MSILGELARFFIARKNFWLWPLIFAMIVIGGLVVFTQGSAIAPFIYTIF